MIAWFVEGYGSFFYDFNKNTLVFSISQKGNKELLEAIKAFFIDRAIQSNLPSRPCLQVSPCEVRLKKGVKQISRRGLSEYLLFNRDAHINR